MVINVERSLPPAIANVVGAPTIFLLLSKVAETTFNTIRYFCADEPQDPRRQISFASSAPPLLRALLDEIFTVIFIGEDVAGRVQWYNKAGWREIREEHDRHLLRYKGKSPEWDTWLAKYGEALDNNQKHFAPTRMLVDSA